MVGAVPAGTAVKIDAVVEGRCWLLDDGQQPVLLEAGEPDQ